MSSIPLQDDGFKWFGEGFDGFPKRLPDDCVEYRVYVVEENPRDVTSTRSQLSQITKSFDKYTRKLLKEYIWQRESFELKQYPDLINAPSQASRPHLRGRTNFGDSISDEWLIVYLLVELSKHHHDAWVRVYDSDGEFLLIEAANALPKWLNPDIAENRVWINNGHLRIIPLGETSSRTNLSLSDALTFIQNHPDKLIISPFIEDEVFYRIRDYPSAISSSLHHAIVTVPRTVAYILNQNPSYISPAIEAFYLRDPVSLKPLSTKDLSTLYFPPEDFVSVSVKFTKVAFAQLKSQIFDAPPAWTGIIPRLDDPRLATGMKVASGLEMLLSDPQNKDNKVVREIQLLLEDVEGGEYSLPTDEDISTWARTEDDESWLDIDYNDFENELSSKKDRDMNDKSKKEGFGDKSAQANLRKMVSRFEDFLNDDSAGADGVDEDDTSDTDSGDDSTGEDKDASFDEAAFERAMKEMMGMPPEQIEESGLLEEARRLAIEDAESSAQEMDEDEEMKKVMELMEKELKGHGALDLNGKRVKHRGVSPKQSDKSASTGKGVVFGPELPPSMQKGKEKAVDSADDVGPGNEELSSDDEDFNDIDLGLAKNMLESFKGQVGTAGPAGNLMRALGVNMPRDEDDNEG